MCDLRIALPFIKINGTLCGVGLKIRHDSVKPHCRLVLECSMRELLKPRSRLSRWEVCQGLMSRKPIWASYVICTLVHALYIRRIVSII